MKMRTMIISFLCIFSWLGETSEAQNPPASKTKAPICGMVTMGRLSFLQNDTLPDNSLKEANAHPGVYAAAVLLVKWSQIEPKQDVFDFSAIDDGLSAIAKYNKNHPVKPIVGKLRVFPGVTAPDWAKALDNGPVTIYDPGYGGSRQIGHFWVQSYREAWHKLQTELADRYDNNPLLGEVAVSSCASLDAEPFIAPLNASSIKSLHEAGFSDALFKSCLMHANEDYSDWKKTAIDYTFNPFRASDT